MPFRYLYCATVLAAGWHPVAACADDPPAAAPQAVDFERTLAEWKKLLADLRIVHAKYQLAGQGERPGLEQQANELLGKLNRMAPTLEQAAIARFKLDPAAEPSLGDFIFQRAKDNLSGDRPDLAAQLCEALSAGKYENASLAQVAAEAAFNDNDFARSRQIAQAAADQNPDDKLMRRLLERATRHEELWHSEQALRAAEAQAGNLPRVKLETTKGTIVVELFANEAPQTVANFLKLVGEGFYDGLKFHRVIGNFVAQGGDPAGNGTGGPGYTIPCECYQDNYRHHFRGSLSMAHAGKDTGGSQFFLTFLPTDHLDGKHTVFGRIVEGLDVPPRFVRTDPSRPNVVPDKIVKATIVRGPAAPASQ